MQIETATDARSRLADLALELFAAEASGLIHNATYRDHLAHEIATAEAAFVGLAVTEIASFRAQLSGPQLG